MSLTATRTKPSKQTRVTRWTPVSERTPAEENRYLVTFQNTDQDRYAAILQWLNGHWYDEDDFNDERRFDDKVTHWAPTPELPPVDA